MGLSASGAHEGRTKAEAPAREPTKMHRAAPAEIRPKHQRQQHAAACCSILQRAKIVT